MEGSHPMSSEIFILVAGQNSRYSRTSQKAMLRAKRKGDGSHLLSLSYRADRSLLVIPAVQLATLHHERHLLQDRDVGEGIAWNSNDVREISRFEGADLILPAEKFCAVQKIGLERGKGSQAILHYQHEFASLGAVGKWADVGADGHRYACGELLAKFLGMEVLHAMFAFGLRGAGGMVGEIFGDGEGGDGEDLFFAH